MSKQEKLISPKPTPSGGAVNTTRKSIAKVGKLAYLDMFCSAELLRGSDLYGKGLPKASKAIRFQDIVEVVEIQDDFGDGHLWCKVRLLDDTKLWTLEHWLQPVDTILVKPSATPISDTLPPATPQIATGQQSECKLLNHQKTNDLPVVEPLDHYPLWLR